MNGNQPQRTIVIFTDSFPYCKESERTFMIPEIMAAAETFDRVVVVPTAVRADESASFACPANVEVDMSWVRSLSGHSRLARALRLINPRLWFEARGDISRSGLSFSAVGSAMSHWLHDWIKTRGFDMKLTVFYSFWFDIAALALAMEKRRNSALRFVSGGHGFDVFTTRGGHLRRLMMEQVERVAVASCSGRDYLIEQFPDLASKIESRRLGCVKLFHDVLTRGHSGSEHSITVLSVSNVVPVKRVEMHARLMRGLATARETTAVRWIHVGDGPDLEALRARLAAERMPANFSWELRGAMSNEEVQRIYRDEKIDWFMMLSLREGGNPIAVCEAIAYGVPVIVSDTTGLAEMVEDDYGVVMPVDVSREAFVRGLLPYLESDYRREAMRQAAAARWAEGFDATRLRKDFFKSIAHE